MIDRRLADLLDSAPAPHGTDCYQCHRPAGTRLTVAVPAPEDFFCPDGVAQLDWCGDPTGCPPLLRY